MLERVVSGGQTGVDQAAWRAARRCGIPTGGRMPRGWLTEDGPRPEFAALYGASEHESPEYPARTEANVLAADATLWIGGGDSAGFDCTIGACRRHARPYLIADLDRDPHDVAAWIVASGLRTINVAGNRESTSSGIGERAERHLVDVLRRLVLEPKM
jgi:hypothetical protein